MSVVLVVVGTGLVAVALVDLAITVLPVAARGGPLTALLAKSLWRLPPRQSERGGHHKALQAASFTIVVVVLATWVVLLWGGWSLVFMGGETAVVEATGGQPADGWARVYYAGFSTFSLGTGDYRPEGTLWQLASVGSVLTGFSLITLVVTYVLGVVSAETHKRRVASSIAAMGSSPADVLCRAWDGRSLQDLDTHLHALSSELSQLAQQHFAYPVLHYLHSDDVHTAVPPNVARLGELLHVVRTELPNAGVSALTLRATESAISSLLLTRQYIDVGQASEVPPPDTDSLKAEGLPVDAEGAARATESDVEWRKRLLELVHTDGWRWDDHVSPARHGP